MYTLFSCENRSMCSLAIKAQWMKAPKETGSLLTNPGPFSINGMKSFSLNLFIGVLFSVSPSYKLIRDCIWLQFWVISSATLEEMFAYYPVRGGMQGQHKMPPQQYCILPEDTSDLQQDILVCLQVRDLETICWNFKVWFCNFFLEKLFHLKLLHLKQVRLLISIKAPNLFWIQNLHRMIKQNIDTLQINELKWCINIINVFIRPCNEFQVAWLTRVCSRIVCRSHGGY